MSHTKGPWEIEEKDNILIIFNREDCYTERFDSDFCGTICTMDVTCCPEEDNANAHLIASAPDLLEACELILEEEISTLLSTELTERAYKKINKAIKKAKGE